MVNFNNYGYYLYCDYCYHFAKPKLNLNFLLSHLNICLLFYFAIILKGENIEDEIRQPHVAAIVSKVATIKEVRVKLVAQQQEMGANGGIVMDGRDIGSVVFPNAELKLFVTASTAIRSKRRFLELQGKGIKQDIEEVEKNLIERDHIDSTREESPLIQVEDAIVLDNSELSKEEQLEWALNKAFDIIQPSSSI